MKSTKPIFGTFTVASRPSFYDGYYHQEYGIFYESDLGGGMTAKKAVGVIYGPRSYVKTIASVLNNAIMDGPTKPKLPWKPKDKVGKALHAVEKAGRKRDH